MRTETFASRYQGIETWDDREILESLLESQFLALAAIKPSIGAIAEAASRTADRLRSRSGRLLYAGAGTSGRLAVQDGTELVPTYGWPRERLAFLIAGGTDALTRSIEGAEDDGTAGATAFSESSTGADDVLIAVSASGTTPYTVGACQAAKTAGSLTVGVAQNENSRLLTLTDHPIWIDTGPEPIAGSTRMKAGTAQKAVLNLLSTLTMIRLGRVYKGLMVDVQATNEKLVGRAIRMVEEITGADKATAERALEAAGGHVKLAALVARGLTPEAGRTLLKDSDDDLAAALTRL